jgi:rhodanese-related sulfurtransferase
MKSRFVVSFGLASLISFCALAGEYDDSLAEGYAKLFAPVAGAAAGKGLHCMPPEKFIKELQAGKRFVPLDVRTQNEAGIYGVTLPGSLAIPVNEVFLPENLARIPQDETVLVVCKSGTRAAAVATALRHIGFSDVYILKGGLMALAKYLDPKVANPPRK